ncbi:nitric oxide dioxygenase [Pseudoalteromonas ulvae UL12]|uniref:NO-inducible flavohemoprotein n=1 Tax=Pseudoalteromonas ulvae TaxID=107327 RepID=UPI00186BA1AC|nr:NO-inducible flavohemoprotein [Pseudoalteromonas ulvae]MBE0362065.1 nitric oxide dioxygenase [Pseudoalteromonas ulvae UL12]
MLSEQQLGLIKTTIPVLESAGPALTAHFYQRLFSHHPQLQHIFNMSNQKSGRQQLALFEAIAAYAKNIENVSVLIGAVERIAQKHTSLNIQAEHYAIVGEHLLATLDELAPESFPKNVLAAWQSAYQVLAGIFIEREAQLYQERSNAAGGWRGPRAFKLIAKEVESELVTSFTFSPLDGLPVLDYVSGQYIGIEVKIPTAEFKEIRQYSLSQASNGESYRISVKRENTPFIGVVSNYLHNELMLGDEVTLYPPSGEFFLVDRDAPVVLISAGVGITPMMAMLDTLAKQEYKLPVSFLHACNSLAQQSFAQNTQALCQQLNAAHYIWHQHEHVENARHGTMQLNAVPLPIELGDFYICGPIGFMQFAYQQLRELGVAASRIHYEVFGPHANIFDH